MKIDFKKIEKKAFENVEMREPTVQDMLTAQRVADASEGAKYEAALIAAICTFDGKSLLMEEVMQLSMDDFFQLKDVLSGGALTTLVKQLLSSQNNQDLDPKPSSDLQ